MEHRLVTGGCLFGKDRDLWDVTLQSVPALECNTHQPSFDSIVRSVVGLRESLCDYPNISIEVRLGSFPKAALVVSGVIGGTTRKLIEETLSTQMVQVDQLSRSLQQWATENRKLDNRKIDALAWLASHRDLGSVKMASLRESIDSRIHETQDSITLMGIKWKADVISILGPLLILVVTFNFLVHITHLQEFAPDEIRGFPWPGLFGGKAGSIYAYLSFPILPSFSAIVFFARVSPWSGWFFLVNMLGIVGLSMSIVSSTRVMISLRSTLRLSQDSSHREPRLADEGSS